MNAFILVAITCLLSVSYAETTTDSDLGGEPRIGHDVARRIVEMSDAGGRLKIRLNYSEGCYLDSVKVNGREIVVAATGVCTGIQVGGDWVTTRTPVGAPIVKIDGQTVSIGRIDFSAGGVSVRESWRFQVEKEKIEWRIHRQYLTGGTVDDSYFPGWDFTDISTWTAGILDTGGVTWSRYLGSHASYGVHAGSVNFWKDHDALKVTTTAFKNEHLASRFTHQASGPLTFVQSVNKEVLGTKHQLHRSISGVDVWAPFSVKPGTLQTILTLEATDADEMRMRCG